MADDNSDENIDQGPAWGWGWLSGAAKAAKDAFDSNVKPALQSMENSTAQFVQDVTKVIDLQIEEPEAPEEVQTERDKAPESSYPASEVPHDESRTEEPADDSIFSDAIGGFTYIGDMVKKLGTQIGDMDQMEATLKRGGDKLKTAWNEAYQFITEDEEHQRQPHASSSTSSAPQTPSKPSESGASRDTNLNPSTPAHASTPSSSGATFTAPATPATPSSRGTLASPTFASLFEAKMGTIDFASLENMSMQSSLQLQQMLRKMTDDQRAAVVTQQEELRAIFAPDLLSEGSTVLDFSAIALPEATKKSSTTEESKDAEEGESAVDTDEKQARERFTTSAQSIHQKLAFYASRTASLQSLALKAITEVVVPESGDIQVLSETTLNYRGKMQLEALRQMAEFTALSVHQLLLAAEYANTAQKNHRTDMVALAQLMHNMALSSKANVAAIAQQIVSAMKTIGNSFKEKATGAAQHPEKQSTGTATLKRISSGMNNVHLDLATAMGSILDASRFSLALFQHLRALELE